MTPAVNCNGTLQPVSTAGNVKLAAKLPSAAVATGGESANGTPEIDTATGELTLKPLALTATMVPPEPVLGVMVKHT